MKKLIPCLMCVVFLLVAISINPVYAYVPEIIEFSYNGKIFNYNLQENIKQSSVFDINYEINKYKRFSTKEERVTLLKHMVNIGIEKSIALDYIFPNLNKKINQVKNRTMFCFVLNFVLLYALKFHCKRIKIILSNIIT